jgi:hypothetical protein
VTNYGITSKEVKKISILDKLHEWSSSLISIADSDLFRYLTSDISDPAKAYIIHEIFLCVSDEEISFLKLMSNSIRICLFKPIEAIVYDSTLRYVLNTNMIRIIKRIVNPDLDEYAFESLSDKIFYAPLDSNLDGETILGGYIFLNSKYMSMTSIYQASSKIVLVHELAHLLLRLQDSKYNFMKDTTLFEPPVSDLQAEKKTVDVGDFVETELFGFALYYINDSTIDFLNNIRVWNYILSKFKLEFRKCIEKKEEKKPLKRFRHQDRYQMMRTKKCVIRPRNYYIEDIEENKESP